jgi:hypothetical protein
MKISEVEKLLKDLRQSIRQRNMLVDILKVYDQNNDDVESHNISVHSYKKLVDIEVDIKNTDDNSPYAERTLEAFNLPLNNAETFLIVIELCLRDLENYIKDILAQLQCENINMYDIEDIVVKPYEFKYKISKITE